MKNDDADDDEEERRRKQHLVDAAQTRHKSCAVRRGLGRRQCLAPAAGHASLLTPAPSSCGDKKTPKR